VSGIAGFFNLDDRQANRSQLENMIKAMPHRFNHKVGTYIDQSIGLASETGPLEIHSCVIAGQLRIDNREELCNQLRIKNLIGLSDEEIVLRAYLQWNKRCVEKLLGAFVFAIWDKSNKTLFAARDHFGIKPFIYYLSDRLFAFASEAKSILSLSAVPKEINEEAICVHFHPELLFQNKSITFYKDIYRLPPAHTLTVTPEKSAKKEYWSIDPYRETVYTNEEDYYNKFQELFFQAVDSRLRTDEKLATTLSGGLDSSSVACATQQLLNKSKHPNINTYSAIFDQVKSADEREWINSVLNMGGFNPSYVHPDEISPLTDIDTLLWLNDGPFYGTNYFIMWSIYKQAAEDGVKVLLDGEDGDTTVSHGIDQLMQLVQSEDWGSFFNECDAIVKGFDNEKTYASKKGMVKGYGLPYLTYLARSGRWKSLYKGIKAIHSYADIPLRSLIKQNVIKPILKVDNKSYNLKLNSVLSEKLIEQYNVAEQLKSVQEIYLSEKYPAHPRKNHLTFINSGARAYALEFFEKMGTYWGIDVRHPFFDKRLVEFCLSVPPSLKLKNGLSRYILRQSMEEVLPESVKNRTGKGDLSQVSVRGLRKFDRDSILSILNNNYSIKKYINIDDLRSSINNFILSKEDKEIDDVWRTFILHKYIE